MIRDLKPIPFARGSTTCVRVSCVAISALSFYFGSPVSPEKLKDYSEHQVESFPPQQDFANSWKQPTHLPTVDSLVNVANSALKGGHVPLPRWYDFPESQTRVLHYTLLKTHLRIHRAFENSLLGVQHHPPRHDQQPRREAAADLAHGTPRLVSTPTLLSAVTCSLLTSCPLLSCADDRVTVSPDRRDCASLPGHRIRARLGRHFEPATDATPLPCPCLCRSSSGMCVYRSVEFSSQDCVPRTRDTDARFSHEFASTGDRLRRPPAAKGALRVSNHLLPRFVALHRS